MPEDTRIVVDKSPEIANLLNPAFCGEIIRRCTEGYEKTGNERLPFALAFLILPLVLDSETRKTMSHYKRTIPIWVNSHPEIKIHLAQRARYLIEYTRRSIIFSLQKESLKLDLKSGLTAVQRELSEKQPTDPELNEMFKKAELLGRLLAASGKPETIYSILGVRP